jgi:hypothetical protein
MKIPKYDGPVLQFNTYELTEYVNCNCITHVTFDAPLALMNAPSGTTKLDGVGPAVKL